MKNEFVNYLRCPSCGGSIDYSAKIVYTENDLEWGTLICSGCKVKYPVALGIPIIKEENDFVDINTYYKIQNTIIHQGPLVKNMIREIENGDIGHVKRKLMFFPLPRTTLKMNVNHGEPFNYENKLSHLLPQKISKLLGKRNLYFIYWLLTKLSLQSLRFRIQEEKIYKKLLSANSAIEFMDLYFKYSGQREMKDYFRYRFGQPRYLAALDLLSLLPVNEKPILDIACGTGHLIHYLANRNKNQPIIGMDRDFTQLYIAKKFISPQSDYYCADAKLPLPFPKELFSGVACSDAFQYFSSKEKICNEMKRVVAKDGIICITRVSNHSMNGYYGLDKITPEKLKSYFEGIPNIILGENNLVEDYIRKVGPDLSQELPLEELNKFSWISIIASHNKEIFRRYNQFIEWPHMMGYLNINPLYQEIGIDEYGNKTFQFKFPNSWYEFENHDWLKYAPKKITIDKDTQELISQNGIDSKIEDLIAKWVLIGMPKHYLQ